jgi:hypothetical protein
MNIFFHCQENQEVKRSSPTPFINSATPFPTLFCNFPQLISRMPPDFKMEDSKTGSISTKEDQKMKIDQNLDT